MWMAGNEASTSSSTSATPLRVKGPERSSSSKVTSTSLLSDESGPFTDSEGAGLGLDGQNLAPGTYGTEEELTLDRSASASSDHPSRSSFSRQYKMTGEKLGIGSLCDGVFGAVHRETNRQVAVKVITLEGLPRRRRIDLNNEMRLQASLNHPHVASLLEVFRSKKYHRIVMDRLTGGDVLTHLQESGTLSEDEASSVTRQALEAVDYLHNKGVVHRDIKLENLVYETETRTTVKLIDFGLSVMWDEGRPSMTRLCGTLSCMAPEVMSGCYTNKADLWCVGMAVHQMVTGKMPARNPHVVLSEQLSSDFPDAEDLIRALLATDADNRPSARQALLHSWFGPSTMTESRSTAIPQSCGQGTSYCTIGTYHVMELEPMADVPDIIAEGSCRPLEQGESNESQVPRTSETFSGPSRTSRTSRASSGATAARQDLQPSGSSTSQSEVTRHLSAARSFVRQRVSALWGAMRGNQATSLTPVQILPQ